MGCLVVVVVVVVVVVGLLVRTLEVSALRQQVNGMLSTQGVVGELGVITGRTACGGPQQHEHTVRESTNAGGACTYSSES